MRKNKSKLFEEKEISEIPLYRLKKELRILKSKYSSNKTIVSDDERISDLHQLDLIEGELKRRLSKLCSERVVRLY